MLSTYLILFVLTLLGLALLKRHLDAHRKLPPGPLGVPLLGYLPFLNVFDLGGSFAKLGSKYGDVFSLRTGTKMSVVLNSYEAVKSAFSNPDLLARPDTFMFRFFSHGQNGLASASGDSWNVQRKFTHKTLRSLGFGSAKMEAHLQDEVSELVDLLEAKAEGGKPVEIGYDINVSVVNVIWALISGERRPHGDLELRSFLTSVNKGIELASTSGVLLFMPFLAKLLPEWVFKLDEMKKWMSQSYGFLSKVIGEHKASFDPETPRDFIDSFLAESAKPGAHSSFNEFQLQVLCSELFGAGGEPTSVTLKWALRFLALYPEVQAKAAAEIEAAVGNDSRVAFADRSKLPYVQALVHEIVRFSDIHPIGVLHSPSVDTSIDGYAVPEGTFVFPNFHQIHRDPEHWSHPDVLHPEHWLDAEGRFTGGNRKGFIAFGVGKRKCPGQEVALMELFVFVSNLVQKFKFSLPEGAPVDCEKTMGAVVGPKPYDIVLEPRF